MTHDVVGVAPAMVDAANGQHHPGLPSIRPHTDQRPRRRSTSADLTVIVPTRNEAASVEQLLDRLAATASRPTEVLFIDDSDDGTPYTVRRLVEERDWGPLAIELLHRPARRRSGGLGGAVCDGIRHAATEWVCVMDGDLQHPPEAIARMVQEARNGRHDLVVGSRFRGQTPAGLSPARRRVSQACLETLHAAFPHRLRDVTDPLSGFFLVRRDRLDLDRLRPNGFKILLEILATHPDLSVGEIGFRFDDRRFGQSKAGVKEGVRFARQVARLRMAAGRIRPTVPRFHYAIHDTFTVSSEIQLPELAKFRVRRHLAPPDLDVRVGRDRRDLELVDLAHAEPEIHYAESLGSSGFAIDVVGGERTHVRVSPTVARSPHVLYTNVVEPILRWRLVEAGYALVHAACFTDGEAAHLITARTDTGKTTTMLKVLEDSDFEFVSDDLCLVDERGGVHTYPKPLTISNHTVHALSGAELNRAERLTLPLQSRLHSRTGRRFAFLIAGSRLPVATINALVQRLIPPPKYHVEQLVPGVRTHRHATIESLFIIERGDDETTTVLEDDDALRILLENCDDAYGFPPYEELEALLHRISGDDLRAREKRIIAAALDGVPASLLTSSTMAWADAIKAELGDRPVAPTAERA